MARTIPEIKKDMTDTWMGDETVRTMYGIEDGDTFENRFKKPHIENRLFFVIAYALHIFERLFGTKKDELTAYVDAMRPHTKEWYIKMMKQYQHGDAFNESLGRYETFDESKQTVKYCSLSINTSNVIVFKIAAEDNGRPKKIEQAQDISAILSYINRIKDAGVRCQIFSFDPDRFKCRIDIVYDPTLLNIDGSKVGDSGSFPVIDAVRDYFQSFPYNSIYSNMALTDAIQKVPGVVVVQIEESWAKKELDGMSWEQILSTYDPRAGYMTFEDEDIQIDYHL